MTYSILLVVIEAIFVFGYTGLLAYYGLGSLLCRDPVWRAFSKDMLPGITLALTLSLCLAAFHSFAHLMGWTTIWWPASPQL